MKGQSSKAARLLSLFSQLPKGMGLHHVVNLLKGSDAGKPIQTGGSKTNGPARKGMQKSFFSARGYGSRNKYEHVEDGLTPAGRRRLRKANAA